MRRNVRRLSRRGWGARHTERVRRTSDPQCEDEQRASLSRLADENHKGEIDRLHAPSDRRSLARTHVRLQLGVKGTVELGNQARALTRAGSAPDSPDLGALRRRRLRKGACTLSDQGRYRLTFLRVPPTVSGIR